MVIPFESVEDLTEFIVSQELRAPFCFIGGDPLRKAMFWIDDENQPAIVDVVECLSPPRGLGCAPVYGKAVHIHRDGSWWFWIETWSDEEGPYKSREEAEEKCKEYADSL